MGCRPRSGAGCFQCGCRECNANVIGVEHNQFKNFARFSEVELRVTCETNGEAHIQAIADKFKENGYIIQKIN